MSNSVSKEHFAFFTKFLQDNSGYNLTEDKQYLLESRLKIVLDVDQLPDIAAIVKEVSRNATGPIAEHVIEAMTINETFFFRDSTPFTTFEQEILPTLAEWGKSRMIRIWSAACSTGQEPYSLAMILEDNKAKYPHLNYEIIASDINNRILSKARQGLFSDMEVNRGLPPKYKDKYFTKDGSQWQVKESIRKHIQFRFINLKSDFIGLGTFDVVMLRNVLIYFDAGLKENVLSKIEKVLRKDGYLILGAAEGIHDPKHYFSRCADIKGVYRHRGMIENKKSGS